MGAADDVGFDLAIEEVAAWHECQDSDSLRYVGCVCLWPGYCMLAVSWGSVTLVVLEQSPKSLPASCECKRQNPKPDKFSCLAWIPSVSAETRQIFNPVPTTITITSVISNPSGKP